jgi:hypothetical protein
MVSKVIRRKERKEEAGIENDQIFILYTRGRKKRMTA